MSRGSSRVAVTTKVSDERAYEIVRRPVITEKSTLSSEHNQIAFIVAKNATKPEIKAAVERLFKVKVTSRARKSAFAAILASAPASRRPM